MNEVTAIEILPEKILLVDDEPLVRNTVSKYLSKIGYSIETAEDGQVAIDKLKINTYDLVLTDLKMPNLDGSKLLQYLASNHPEIPKIVLTGYGEDKDIIVALKAGANDFLYKPIGDFAILLHSVQKALDIKKLNDEKNRYNEQLKQINEIISLLNKGKSTDEIFKSLSASLKKIIPFNRLSLMFIDQARNTLLTKFIGSDNEKIIKEEDTISMDSKTLNEYAKLRETLIINNPEEYKTKNSLLKEGMYSSLILPLIINDNVRGFLNLSSTIRGFFHQEHIAFMESIVGHISLSIQRGELLDNLEHLVELRTKKILSTQRTTIFALSNLAEIRDHETGEHLDRIRKYSILTAQILKYSKKYSNISNIFLRDLYDSSILHDIGKVGIPDIILRKPGPLNNDELEIIKKHVKIGYNALKLASQDLGENSFLKMAMEIILYHHEHWDGSGYPEGLIGEDIPLAARIVTISDVYDALTSKRPYKEAYSHEKSIKLMQKNISYYDPVLFEIFIDNSSEYDMIRQQTLKMNS